MDHHTWKQPATKGQRRTHSQNLGGSHAKAAKAEWGAGWRLLSNAQREAEVAKQMMKIVSARAEFSADMADLFETWLQALADAGIGD